MSATPSRSTTAGTRSLSSLLQEVVSLQTIERLAGSSVKKIIQVDGHLVPEDLARAVAAVGRNAREDEDAEHIR